MELEEFPKNLLEMIEINNSRGKRLFKLDEVVPKGQRNDHLFKYGCKLRATGMKVNEIHAALKVINNERTDAKLLDDEIMTIVESVSKYREGFSMNFNTLVQVNTNENDNLSGALSHLQDGLGITKTMQGQPVCNVDNVLKVLEGYEGLKGEIWYDEFHQKIFTTWRTGIEREWSDAETIALQVSLQRLVGLARLGKEAVVDAVLIYSSHQIKNKPKDRMESLVWDKTQRIEKLFIDYFGAVDNDYTRAASKNFAVSIVARIYAPGCKVDTMPVLQGGQGTFKSSGVEALIGKEFYCDAHESVTSKDFFQIFPGKILIEIAELDAFSKAEVTRVKQIITCKNDRYRASYARFAEDHPRQCVFIGTTNEDNFLKDATGARRFWPIKIGMIKIPLIVADRDQLFAEAVYLYKSGATWWEMPPSTKDEQDERRQIDPWEERIFSFIQIKGEVTTNEILDSLGIPVKEQGTPYQMRVGKILKFLQWERKKKRTGATTKWVYEPVISMPKRDISWED